MKKDHLLQIIKALTEDEKKMVGKRVKDIPKSKRPYYLELYICYKKLLEKGCDDIQLYEELEKILKRRPKMKRDIANIRHELKEKLQTIMFQNLLLDVSENRVHKNIKLIEIFVVRKLFDEAQLLINETKKKAKLLDLNKHLIELIDLELSLLGKQSSSRDAINQNNLINQINSYSHLFALELQLKNIFRQLTLIIQKDVSLKKDESIVALKSVYKQLNFENILIDDYKKAKHTHVVIWYYRIQNLFHRSMRNYENAFQCSQSLITYFESDTNLIKNFESRYVKSICGFIQTCYASNKHNPLNNSLEKVKHLYDAKPNYNALMVTCDIGVLHYINTFKYEKAKELTELMKKDWNKINLRNDDGKLLWYCSNNMLLFWVLNNQTDFKYWLNEGLRISRSHKGKDYYFGIRMFELIDNFEQEKWDDFQKKIESLQVIRLFILNR